jgi:metal-responsive CopG/Arc/MetJ family transcriptional regulator
MSPTRLSTKPGAVISVKTAISLPDPLFEEAEAAAKDLGLSRSKLMQLALREFLNSRKEAKRTAAVNRNIAKYGDPSDGQEARIEHSRKILANMERDE